MGCRNVTREEKGRGERLADAMHGENIYQSAESTQRMKSEGVHSPGTFFLREEKGSETWVSFYLETSEENATLSHLTHFILPSFSLSVSLFFIFSSFSARSFCSSRPGSSSPSSPSAKTICVREKILNAGSCSLSDKNSVGRGAREKSKEEDVLFLPLHSIRKQKSAKEETGGRKDSKCEVHSQTEGEGERKKCVKAVEVVQMCEGSFVLHELYWIFVYARVKKVD